VLDQRGRAADIPRMVDDIIHASNDVVAVSRDDAIRAGPLQTELRKSHKDASLMDAVVLSIARNRGAKVVSCDIALKGQADVVCEP
jgi:predicted nucleic acid-binding protein